jgi:hypothetical protein
VEVMKVGSEVDGSGGSHGRMRRALAAVLLVTPIAAIVLGTLLVFTQVAPGGSACGTVLAPREPPNDPPAGCPGTIAVRIVGAILSGIVAVASGAAAAVLIRRQRHAAGSHRSAPARPPAWQASGSPVLGLPSSALGRVAGPLTWAVRLDERDPEPEDDRPTTRRGGRSGLRARQGHAQVPLTVPRLRAARGR